MENGNGNGNGNSGRWGTGLKVGTMLAALVVAPATLAMDSGSDSIHLKISGKAGTLEEVDVSHLEVGDSEQLSTDSGESVLLTRTETGLDVEVGDETIEVRFDHDAKALFIGDADGDGHVVVQHLGAGDNESMVWVAKCEEDEEDCEKAVGHTFRHVIIEERSTSAGNDADSGGETTDSRVKVFVVEGDEVDEEADHESEDHDVRIMRVGGGEGTTIIVKRIRKTAEEDQ